jgi:PAS domain S-box-containing protein
MVRGIRSYLDLAALAEVGAFQLANRPVLVLSADGTQVLWANTAGSAFLGVRNVAELLGLRFSDLNPVRSQVTRLAKTLPSATARMEVLRFGRGAALVAVPAACRRLNLARDERAVLVVAVEGDGEESITARAEKLVDFLGSDDRAAAVLAENGKTIAASQSFDAFSSSEPAIPRFVDAAAGASRAVHEHFRTTDFYAGVAGFMDGGRRLLLVVAEPAPEAAQAKQSVPPSGDDAAPDETPIEAMFPEMPDEAGDPAEPATSPDEAVAEDDEPEPLPPAIVRFAWEIDRGRFRFVSDELAEAVGAKYGAISGKAWDEVSEGLNLDPAGEIARLLSSGRSFTATVFWPHEGCEDCVAVDLAGRPFRSADGTIGHRGFGLIRTDDRRPDQRHDKAGFTAPGAPPASAAEHDEPIPEVDATPAEITPQPRDDLDDAARMSVEEGVGKARDQATGGGGRATRSNVVHLGKQTERLTGTEREAFRRIAEALATKEPEAGDGESSGGVDPRPALENDVPSPEFDARLLDRLPIGIVVFRDRKTLFANRALAELLGYESVNAFVAAGGAESIFPTSGSPGATVTEAGGKLAALKRDGTTVAVKAWLHAVTYAGSTALMLSLGPSGSDSAEETGTAARAMARADELSAILDTATDGVLVVDGRGKIDSMNRAAEALFGVEGDSYRGRYFTDLIADESQKPALDYLDGLASNGVASVLNDGREVIGRVPNGGLIPLFMTMGRIAGTEKFCAVLRDITHWKNVEEELTAARRTAEAANQQKSDFLAKISHEIRTPLNAIIGFSEVMMEERFGSIGNTRYRDYLRDIHVSGAHLMSLINDLLDLSKIEAGKVDLSFESVAANGIIQECVAIMQPQANRERIIIRTSLATDLPEVVADPRSFRQILLNLLSNAIKFTRAGGQVIVSTALEESGEVVVRIRDTGIGMSEKDIETALKPFRQVALSADDREHGTGLGLPLTKAMVEANRASFSIESAPNQGTLVKITFPTTRVLAG